MEVVEVFLGTAFERELKLDCDGKEEGGNE